MDTVSIAGASVLMRTAQTQQAISANLMKHAAEQQNQIAELLSQNAGQPPQSASSNDYNFSTYV